EHPVLAAHVVRARREVAVRRTAEHVLGPARVAEQVGQVRVAARELPELRAAVRPGQPTGEILTHRYRIDLLVRADGDHVGSGRKARGRVLHGPYGSRA